MNRINYLFKSFIQNSKLNKLSFVENNKKYNVSIYQNREKNHKKIIIRKNHTKSMNNVVLYNKKGSYQNDPKFPSGIKKLVAMFIIGSYIYNSNNY